MYAGRYVQFIFLQRFYKFFIMCYVYFRYSAVILCLHLSTLNIVIVRGIIILPIERQNFIKQLMQKNHSMKISELSEKLAVSEITIHRDLKPLIDEGYVLKTFGGVTLSKKEVSSQDRCTYCHSNIHHKLSFKLILKNGGSETTCCPHCGLLRYRQISTQVEQVICQDFLRMTTINARGAHFVMESSLELGCCQPQVLPFEYEKHAKQFVKGFNGVIYSFYEDIHIVYEEMVSSHE